MDGEELGDDGGVVEGVDAGGRRWRRAVLAAGVGRRGGRVGARAGAGAAVHVAAAGVGRCVAGGVRQEAALRRASGAGEKETERREESG